MPPTTAYYLLLLIPAVISITTSLVVVTICASSFMGAPFVPTNTQILEEIFKLEGVFDNPKITTDDIFYDLGCGDGRTVVFTTKKYGARSIGVECNPLLYFINKLVHRNQNVSFRRQNALSTNISDATIIYTFLMPPLLEKLAPKFLNECQKDTRIISHGFKIKGMEQRFIKTKKATPFSTHYYQI